MQKSWLTQGVILATLVLRFVKTDPECTPCPDEASLSPGCSCTAVDYDPCNAISVTSYTLPACISALAQLTPGGYYLVLSVDSAENVDLTDNFLQGLLFEQVLIDTTHVLGVHPEFLGDSRDVTQVLQFGFCQLGEMPVIDGPNVTHFTVKEEEGYVSNFHLSSAEFELLPQLQTLRLYLDQATVMVGYHAFYSLEHLREVEFIDCYSVLDFGSMSFNSKYLEQVKFTNTYASRNQEKKCDVNQVKDFECDDRSGEFGSGVGSPKAKVEEVSAFSATAGSLNGFPRGSSLVISKYNGSWSPEVFLNILSMGSYISVTDPHDCCQDLRWVRYSSFVRRFSISCWSGDGGVISLASVDLNTTECSSWSS